MKWGHFDGAKPTLKIRLASWAFHTILKRFRILNAENLGSVGQRAAKLLAVKVGGLKKKSAGRPRPHSNQSARVRFWSRSNHSQSLMASNFATLWPTDSKFLALKNLNPLKTVLKFQEASSVLKMGFALSKWPHLHRAYLVTVPEYLSQSVRGKGLALTTGCSWVFISWLDKYFFLSPNFLQKNTKIQIIFFPAITKIQSKTYKIITLYYKRTGRAVGKSSRMIWTEHSTLILLISIPF